MRMDGEQTLGYTIEQGAGLKGLPPGRFALGRVGFSEEAVEPGLWNGAPHVSVPMLSPGDEPFTELWSTSAPVTTGSRGDLFYAHDGEHLFCCVYVPPAPTYRERVRSVYAEVFELLEELDYPHVFRIWNMIGDINQANGRGMEVYKDFCLGRAEAFESRPGTIEGMPAATGIGSRGEGVNLHLVAGRSPGVVHIDNPRQIPAYEYPRRYGPKSPSFSRATRREPDGTLYISGTASIIGHDTVHIGDFERQLEETFRNITALIDGENLGRYGITGHQIKDLDSVKVYVRHDRDLPTAKAMCAEVFQGHTDIRYLNVDICRSELLVEVEGILPRT
ncbi:FkbO/Hyg5 family chorismatase [Nocardiopsis alba]|uniref:FkbO/Hyg5 family chorismatase n=1 Tax=Nocardiopsis alba TaxID=53437 RepID=UPI0035DBDC69